MICAECGIQNQEGSRFCIGCGSVIHTQGKHYCRNCGKYEADQAVFCIHCGAAPQKRKNFCQNCSASTNEAQEICVRCGVRLASGTADRKDWLTALLLCIFLGYLGIHRFYTGHTVIGVVQLLTGGACGVWTLIDLIMIATGSFKDNKGFVLLKK
jgi:predicted amidophosphoribosyltransferase